MRNDCLLDTEESNIIISSFYSIFFEISYIILRWRYRCLALQSSFPFATTIINNKDYAEDKGNRKHYRKFRYRCVSSLNQRFHSFSLTQPSILSEKRWVWTRRKAGWAWQASWKRIFLLRPYLPPRYLSKRRMPYLKVKSGPLWQAMSCLRLWKSGTHFPTDKTRLLMPLSSFPSRM